MTISPAERLLTPINGACDSLGVGRTKVYELINQHELVQVSIGRRSFVTTESLRGYVGRHWVPEQRVWRINMRYVGHLVNEILQAGYEVTGLDADGRNRAVEAGESPEVVPGLVELEVAVPRSRPVVW